MEKKLHLMFFEIMNDARDAQLTKGAQQSLLYHLILRCDPKKDYSCFPSFELLCADTGLDMTTVKRAARELEKKGLISRVVRPNRSNLWYVNVKQLQEAADFKRVARADDKAVKHGCPFEPPTIRTQSNAVPPSQSTVTTSKAGTEDASADDIDIPPQPTPEEQIVVQAIHALLKDHLGDHPTYQEPNAKNILDACINQCIAHAGGAKRCKNILRLALEIDDKLEYLSKSRLLGGCLTKCFPGWAAEFDEVELGECKEHLLQFCHGDEAANAPVGSVYAASFQAYLYDTLGDNLIHLHTQEVGDLVRFIVEITDPAKLAHILAAHAGQAVDVASVPESVDSSTVTQLQWAIANEPWATALVESTEPLAYFLDHCEEIAECAADPDPLYTGLDEDEGNA